jgi:hypothetical protein
VGPVLDSPARAIAMLVVSRSIPVVVVTTIFTFLAFIAVVFRLITRVFHTYNVWSEDYVMVAAMVGSGSAVAQSRRRVIRVALTGWTS